MYSGKKPRNVIRNPEATYHQAPNLTTSPFPRGPYELGTVVEDIKFFRPLNQGASRVAIDERLIYTHATGPIEAKANDSRGSELGIVAKFFNKVFGIEGKLEEKKADYDMYSIQNIETVNFHPSKRYLSDCIKLGDVRDYLEGTNYQYPIYLITGLKIARGATVDVVRGRAFDAKADLAARAVIGPVEGVDVEANAVIAGESVLSTKYTTPVDFVLGIQVQKLYHKKSFFSGKISLDSHYETKGATLLDNDVIEDYEGDENFVVVELNNEDTEEEEQFVQELEGEKKVWILKPENPWAL